MSGILVYTTAKCFCNFLYIVFSSKIETVVCVITLRCYCNTNAWESTLACAIAPTYLAPCDSHICAHRVILCFWNINGIVSFWVVSKLSSSIGNTFFFKSWFLFGWKLNLKKIQTTKYHFSLFNTLEALNSCFHKVFLQYAWYIPETLPFSKLALKIAFICDRFRPVNGLQIFCAV